MVALQVSFVSQPAIKRDGGRISIFEELRAQAKSSKFQTPNSKEGPSSKIKNRPARRLPRHLFLGFEMLNFSGACGFGAWCFLQRRLKNRDAPRDGFSHGGN